LFVSEVFSKEETKCSVRLVVGFVVIIEEGECLRCCLVSLFNQIISQFLHGVRTLTRLNLVTINCNQNGFSCFNTTNATTSLKKKQTKSMKGTKECNWNRTSDSKGQENLEGNRE
jgi:hypothetical protein